MVKDDKRNGTFREGYKRVLRDHMNYEKAL
jgi:hypothetical protein